MRGIDVDALVEETVAAHTVPAEAGHSVGNLKSRPTVNPGSLHPSRLTWRVVGHLVLEEDVGPAISVPDHLVFLVVLDEKAVRCHIVSVDDESGVGSVVGPTHTVTVIRPPRPDVIQDDVVAVDDQAVRRPAGRRASNTEEHIVKARWVGGLVVAARMAVADLQ